VQENAYLGTYELRCRPDVKSYIGQPLSGPMSHLCRKVPSFSTCSRHRPDVLWLTGKCQVRREDKSFYRHVQLDSLQRQ